MDRGSELAILLVEDNPADVRLTMEGLEEAEIDCDVTEARTVQGAWEILQEAGGDDLPDLVLLDLNLPGAEGHELLRRIRDDQEMGSLPVVILSTSAALEDVRTCYDLRANSYVTKPTEYETFLDRIRRVGEYWGHINQGPYGSSGHGRA